METVDDEILSHALAFIDKAKRENKPFFVWLNPTRMHVVTHLSEKYQKTRTPQNGWSISEAGMAQIDDIVGAVMQKLRDLGIENNTSSASPPTTAPRTSPGPTAARRRSPAARARPWRAASAPR
jgi:membrane-anchored protein YejM (alkaline phosphatase superfamily)